jgi:hypothetical protein
MRSLAIQMLKPLQIEIERYHDRTIGCCGKGPLGFSGDASRRALGCLVDRLAAGVHGRRGDSRTTCPVVLESLAQPERNIRSLSWRLARHCIRWRTGPGYRSTSASAVCAYSECASSARRTACPAAAEPGRRACMCALSEIGEASTHGRLAAHKCKAAHERPAARASR